MNRTDLNKILVAAARKQAGVNFSDAQSAAKNAIVEHFGLKGLSARELQRRKLEIFDVISEAIDEVVPMMVQDRIGDFAEIKQIARNEQALFRIPTSYASKRRAAKGIQRGARGGIYKAQRLDGKDIPVYTEVWTVGWNITLEEILTGQRTIAEMGEILTNAWVELIFKEVFHALQAAASAAPQVNRVVGGTAAINNQQLDKLISIVKAYGTPRIVGFNQHLSLLGNDVVTTQGVARPTADLDDVRAQGYIKLYKGTQVVELPNYIDVHRDAEVDFVFAEDRIFVMPSEEKPIKIVFQGESYIQEAARAVGGEEYHQHRMMGLVVLFNNYIASYELTDGWNAWAPGTNDGIDHIA